MESIINNTTHNDPWVIVQVGDVKSSYHLSQYSEKYLQRFTEISSGDGVLVLLSSDGDFTLTILSNGKKKPFIIENLSLQLRNKIKMRAEAIQAVMENYNNRHPRIVWANEEIEKSKDKIAEMRLIIENSEDRISERVGAIEVYQLKLHKIATGEYRRRPEPIQEKIRKKMSEIECIKVIIVNSEAKIEECNARIAIAERTIADIDSSLDKISYPTRK